MKNVKKISHGKYFRVALTEEGKLFFQGQSRKYMLGSCNNHESKWDDFCLINERFFRNDEDDKLVDVVGGRNYTAVLTEKGRIFATSYIFWRSFSGCRENPENYEDTPFELKLPEGYTGKCLFGSIKDRIWVNVVDSEGKMKTFANGQKTCELGI